MALKWPRSRAPFLSTVLIGVAALFNRCVSFWGSRVQICAVIEGFTGLFVLPDVFLALDKRGIGFNRIGNEGTNIMMKRGMSFLLSSAAVVAMTAGFAGVANAGAGGCCDQVEDLQRQIYLLQSQIDELKANPGGLSPKWKAAPEWSEDGHKFKVRGRIYVDATQTNFDDGTTDTDGFHTEFRTARIGVEGQIMKNTKYKAEIDFAEDAIEITDMYLQQKFGPAKVTIGQFKSKNSLEELTSSRHVLFMERADFTDVFGIDRQIGIGVDFGGDNWTFGVAAQGEADDQSGQSGVENENLTYSARGTFAPIAEDEKSVHLGAHVRYETEQDQFDTDLDSGWSAVDGGLNDSVDMIGAIATTNLIESSLMYGFEAAGVYGPFHLQGEYTRLDLSGDGFADEPSFYGWYIQGSVFLTGESMTYKASKGVFDRVKVKNPVNEGGLGAWQLAVKYDYTNLDDGSLDIGDAGTISAVVNWHLNNYTKMKLQYNYTDAEGGVNNGGACGTSNDCDQQSIGFRAQVDW